MNEFVTLTISLTGIVADGIVWIDEANVLCLQHEFVPSFSIVRIVKYIVKDKRMYIRKSCFQLQKKQNFFLCNLQNY